MKKCLVILCLCVIVFAQAAASQAVQYEIVDLGTLGGNRVVPYGINDSGQVVGFSYLTGNNADHAFLRQGGHMEDLGALPGGPYSSSANAINNSGQIVGISGNPTGHYACVWQNKTPAALSSLPYPYTNTEAYDINSAGQIVGQGWSQSGRTACIWEDGAADTLPGLGGDYGIALSINTTGKVAGYATVESGTYHACLWVNNEVTDLGPGYAYDINDQGQIVGTSFAQGGGFWQDNTFTPLSGLDTTYKYASPGAINNSGMIVGCARYSTLYATYTKACLWQNGTVTELPSLQDWLQGYSQATEVNNNGQIIGFAFDSNNVQHAVLWQPVPEPSSILALFGGLGSLLAFRRRSH